MDRSRRIYLGVKGSVVALDPVTGNQLWATHLKGSGFVNVVLDGALLYGATQGELFCLEPKTGELRWHNPLKGYGLGLVTVAGEDSPQNLAALTEEMNLRDQEAAAGSTAASST